MRFLWFLLFLPLLSAQEVRFVMPPPPVVVAPALLRWQLDTVAACLVLEAACQGEAGMRGVMAVICNRARGEPRRFAAVVQQPWQFSAFNALTAGKESSWQLVRRAQRDIRWADALRLAQEACLPEWLDPTGGATHYTRVTERPAWARQMRLTIVIGQHAFYR